MRSMIHKNRRQRAWVRLMLKTKWPKLRARVFLFFLMLRIKVARWRAARLDAARIKAIKKHVAKQKIDPNAPCPSCGARDGKIAFSPTHGQVLHRCNVDGAIWAEPPIITWNDWKVDVTEEQMPEPLALIEAWQKNKVAQSSAAAGKTQIQ